MSGKFKDIKSIITNFYSETLTGPQLLKKSPAYSGTRIFNTSFTRGRRLSQIDPVRGPPQFFKVDFNIILLCLGLPGGLLPSGFPTKTLYTPLLAPLRATCPAYLSLLDLITQMISVEHYRA
jgi:hypothetical protein